MATNETNATNNDQLGSTMAKAPSPTINKNAQSTLEQDVEENRSEQTQSGDNDQETSSDSSPKASSPKTVGSIYTSNEKWIVVTIISVAGFFSPFTANIYFPVIPTIARAFHKSVSLINLSVTIYMVFQGIAPMFWGTLSDYKGRRPIYLMCLLTLALSCVGLALMPTNAYWLLMVLRGLQAVGSASTIALGAGVIGDITKPEERGGMFGLFGVGPLIGPAIAPVIGGVISQNLGWRAIFWFVCIAASVCLLFLLLFLPETLPTIVGDGSITPPKLYRPIIPLIGRTRRRQAQDSDKPYSKPPPKPFTNPLVLVTYPDILLLLLTNGVIMGVFYSIATSMSSIFPDAYPELDTAEIGYCYLAMGGAMAIGTATTGKLLDREYRRRKKVFLENKLQSDDSKGLDLEKMDPRKMDDFPIESARLGSMAYVFFFFIAACAGYGWCVKERVNLAGPLVLQVILGFTSIWIFTSTQCLLIDLVPDRGSSVTACNNLIRCTVGAVMVSVIDPILNGIGIGWTFILFAGFGVIGALMVMAVVKIGPRCRERRQRKERVDEKREARR